jgi:hypothetical protein
MGERYRERMGRSFRRVLFVGVVSVVIGCGQTRDGQAPSEPTFDTTQGPVIRVTNGDRFRVLQDRVVGEKGPAYPALCENSGLKSLWGLVARRFLSVCESCLDRGGWSEDGGLCRIVACTVSADCVSTSDERFPEFASTKFSGPQEFECAGGYCQNRDTAGYPRDVVCGLDLGSLCAKEVPYPAGFPDSGLVPQYVWALPQANAPLSACGRLLAYYQADLPAQCAP